MIRFTVAPPVASHVFFKDINNTASILYMEPDSAGSDNQMYEQVLNGDSKRNGRVYQISNGLKIM